MSEKDRNKALARVLRQTHGQSEPIEVEFTIKPEDHEDGPEWEVTRASGRLPDLAWLDGIVGNSGFKDLMEGAVPGALEPGPYRATIQLHWHLHRGFEGDEDYEETVECAAWSPRP